MSSKVIVATFALLLSAFFSTTATAAPAPKVAFVGDWLTQGWSTSFPANWINDASTGSCYPCALQMAAAIAQKPSIIHIMIGSTYWDDDASYNLVTALLEEDLSTAILQAQAAAIPVVVGIEPLQLTGYEAVSQMDLMVYAVATEYGVPVVNYSGAFSNATTSYAGNVNEYPGTAQGFNGGTAQGFGGVWNFFTTNSSGTTNSAYQPTAAGYAIMTMMAQTAFTTMNAQPKSVYLQDEETGTPNGGVATANVNTVSPGNTVQFYPVISYTNGVSGQAGFDSNFLTDSNGTWTSSNPLAGFVTPSGQFWAINEGTTTVKFTLPNGVWNEWIMYVGAPFRG